MRIRSNGAPQISPSSRSTNMRDDQHRFLALLGQPPARLTTEQTAWLLNCQPHDVPILVSARLLKPLGSSPPNSVKYFATVDLLELAKDRAWLAKATNAVVQHWREKNLHKKDRRPLFPEFGPPEAIGRS